MILGPIRQDGAGNLLIPIAFQSPEPLDEHLRHYGDRSKPAELVVKPQNGGEQFALCISRGGWEAYFKVGRFFLAANRYPGHARTRPDRDLCHTLVCD